MEEPGENITGNSKHYLPLLSPERLKIFERFALGEKCYWISLADGEKEEVEEGTGRGRENKCMCLCVCVVCVCVVCVVCLCCVCVHPCMFVYLLGFLPLFEVGYPSSGA